MIPTSRPLAFFLLCCMAMGSLSSCSASKKATQNHAFLIVLKKELTSVHIIEQYKIYNPSAVKRSNRTLNQYRAVFTLTSKKKQQLLERMAADPKIVEVEEIKQGGIDIQSGSNQKSSKTGPIRKN
ncbi:MAG: hypothetical protein AAFV95_20080 [Bacteroidota bacterium]